MKRPKFPGIRSFIRRPHPVIDEVVHETTSGGVVVRRSAKTHEIEILLMQDAKNRWTIPKGHVEPGEEHGATAEREIMEEVGLQDVEAICWLGKVNFRYRRNHTLVLMTMHIWLVEAQGDTDKLNPEDWLNDVRWLPVKDAIDKIAYEDIGKLILVGMKRIRDERLL